MIHLEKVSWPPHLSHELDKQLCASVRQHTREQTEDGRKESFCRKTAIMYDAGILPVDWCDGCGIDVLCAVYVSTKAMNCLQ